LEHQQSRAPGVALVVLNYNYARYIAAAVESALAQTVAYEQILVVDDGSTDESRQVLERYRGRVELLFKPNGGQLSAALAALPRVRCTYVHYLDSDDYLMPYARELTGKQLDGEPVKLQFRMRCVNEGNALQSLIPAYPETYDNAAMLRDNELIGMPICPPTSGNVFRTDALRALPLQRLDPRDYIDGTPNLAMPYCGEVKTIDQVIANYRLHNHNVSQHQTPTKQGLGEEIERVRRRWRELPRIISGVSGPAPGCALIELEARNMIAAMEGRHEIRLWGSYITTLLRSGMPVRKKLLLGLWSTSLAAAPGRLAAQQLVRARRSAVNRSQLTRKLVGFCLGNRAAESAAYAGLDAAMQR
jgi:glycosyltransferase involved in cell wall biosynthesis